jgi:hypothetical protein
VIEEEVIVEEAPKAAPKAAASNAFQVQISGDDVRVYNFAMAHLRTVGGVESATPQQINPGGTSYVLVNYRGSIATLAAALSGRGWSVDYSGTVLRMRGSGSSPPPLPPPPPPVAPVQQAPAQPPPSAQPPVRPPGEAQ